MNARLDQLAQRLALCRKRGNRMMLDHILESARILAEAKALAGRAFGKWLRVKAHMDRATASRHLRVASFVNRNVASTQQIASLTISKVYALSSLDFDSAQKILRGEVRFSAPLEDLSDVQFRREFRERFPRSPARRTREHFFRSALSSLLRAGRELHRVRRHWARLSQLQRKRILGKVRAMHEILENVSVVA